MTTLLGDDLAYLCVTALGNLRELASDYCLPGAFDGVTAEQLMNLIISTAREPHYVRSLQRYQNGIHNDDCDDFDDEPAA